MYCAFFVPWYLRGMAMFGINCDEIDSLQSHLERLKLSALPYATKQTLNDAAFRTRAFAAESTRKKMILRNTYSVRSIQVQRASGLDISRQVSETGSVISYMAEQEFGGTRYKKTRQGMGIPTSYSAGQGMHASPRTRPTTGRNRKKNLRLHSSRKGRKKRSLTAQQKLIVAVKSAVKHNEREVFLRVPGRKGMYRVEGGRMGKKGKTLATRIKLIWSYQEQSTRTPKNPWLNPAFERTLPLIPYFYETALYFQIRRHGIFKI